MLTENLGNLCGLVGCEAIKIGRNQIIKNFRYLGKEAQLSPESQGRILSNKSH